MEEARETDPEGAERLQEISDEFTNLPDEDFQLWLEVVSGDPQTLKEASEALASQMNDELTVKLAKFCIRAVVSGMNDENRIQEEEIALLEISNPGLQNHH
ncbi:MAG: hypothetical protein AAB719_02595 [Patescibacteria group bacterium]